MATESSVGVINQSGASAVQVDTVSLTPVVAGTPTIGTTNYRQTMVVADPANPAGFAPVDPLLGLTVASAQLGEAIVTLQLILAELQAQTALLGGVSSTAGLASPLS
jgi:hypothetical protein